MLNKHSSSKDTLTVAWEQKDDECKSEKKSQHNESSSTRESITYKSGLNYQTSKPDLKSHTKISGIVTCIKSDESIIIGLKNGLVGVVPKQVIELSKK